MCGSRPFLHYTRLSYAPGLWICIRLYNDLTTTITTTTKERTNLDGSSIQFSVSRPRRDLQLQASETSSAHHDCRMWKQTLFSSPPDNPILFRLSGGVYLPFLLSHPFPKLTLAGTWDQLRQNGVRIKQVPRRRFPATFKLREPHTVNIHDGGTLGFHDKGEWKRAHLHIKKDTNSPSRAR